MEKGAFTCPRFTGKKKTSLGFIDQIDGIVEIRAQNQRCFQLHGGKIKQLCIFILRFFAFIAD